MDYRVYHAVNQFILHHAWLGRAGNAFEGWATPIYGAAAIALWLLGRPGGTLKWKLAASSAVASAGLALLVNQLIAKLWDRPRPFAAHPSAHVWGSRSHDPSFPSDHVSAAFAIATAVLLFDRVAGTLFVSAAVLIGVGRVLVGAHYPGDVGAGVLVGSACGVLVVRLGRPLLTPLVGLLSRITDPVLARFWRTAERA